MSLEFNQIPSTNLNYPLLRLIEQYKRHGRLIIAYDIDDTVRPCFCASCEEVQLLLKNIKNVLNAYFIVYTSNPNIEDIKIYLDKHKIPYDSVNQNAPFISCSGGKVYYNILLDDKAGLAQAVSNLKDLMFLVQNGFVKQLY